MIVATSVLVAISETEPGYVALVDRILAATWVGVGTPGVLEAGMVISGRGQRDGANEMRRLIGYLDLSEVAFGPAHWEPAVRAFQRYGKGRHPAALNFGDCMSYAIAQVEGHPLLYVGEDFAQTDIRAA